MSHITYADDMQIDLEFDSIKFNSNNTDLAYCLNPLGVDGN